MYLIANVETGGNICHIADNAEGNALIARLRDVVGTKVEEMADRLNFRLVLVDNRLFRNDSVFDGGHIDMVARQLDIGSCIFINDLTPAGLERYGQWGLSEKEREILFSEMIYHEYVHLTQMAEGRLAVDDASGNITWEGVMWSKEQQDAVPYLDLPWEREAVLGGIEWMIQLGYHRGFVEAVSRLHYNYYMRQPKGCLSHVIPDDILSKITTPKAA